MPCVESVNELEYEKWGPVIRTIAPCLRCCTSPRTGAAGMAGVAFSRDPDTADQSLGLCLAQPHHFPHPSRHYARLPLPNGPYLCAASSRSTQLLRSCRPLLANSIGSLDPKPPGFAPGAGFRHSASAPAPSGATPTPFFSLSCSSCIGTPPGPRLSSSSCVG